MKITETDCHFLQKIKVYGPVWADLEDNYTLGNSEKITEFRMGRLLEMGLVTPVENKVFDGAKSQQYVLSINFDPELLFTMKHDQNSIQSILDDVGIPASHWAPIKKGKTIIGITVIHNNQKQEVFIPKMMGRLNHDGLKDKLIEAGIAV